MDVTLVNIMEKVINDEDVVPGEGIIRHEEEIDCMPSLRMITINAIVAADSVLIPIGRRILPVKGLQQLIKTIGRVHKRLNPAFDHRLDRQLYTSSA